MTMTNERREFQRYNANAEAQFYFLDAYQETRFQLRGQLIDIGRGGFCLALSRIFAVGLQGVVVIGEGEARIIRGVEIRSARHVPGKGNLHGFRFWSAVPSNALEQLLKTIRHEAEAGTLG